MPLDVSQVRAARPGNQVYHFDSIDSTMNEGARLAHTGAPHGTVVVAEEQLAGVGRFGRHWISERETGLYTSTLLRLPLAPADLPVVNLALGLAAAGAIRAATGLACDLRWPNDVLINERKVAGVLPHLVAGCIVAGIGINVNNTSFEKGLRTPATSLALAIGSGVVSRELVLIHLLESLDLFCEMLISEGAAAIIRAFSSASSYVSNRRVTAEDTGIRGITAGLDQNGFLLLRTPEGQLQRISSGGIRPAA